MCSSNLKSKCFSQTVWLKRISIALILTAALTRTSVNSPAVKHTDATQCMLVGHRCIAGFFRFLLDPLCTMNFILSFYVFCMHSNWRKTNIVEECSMWMHSAALLVEDFCDCFCKWQVMKNYEFELWISVVGKVMEANRFIKSLLLKTEGSFQRIWTNPVLNWVAQRLFFARHFAVQIGLTSIPNRNFRVALLCNSPDCAHDSGGFLSEVF